MNACDCDLVTSECLCQLYVAVSTLPDGLEDYDYAYDCSNER